MTAQLFAFPIPDTLDRHALHLAAAALRLDLDLDPACSDLQLRAAVQAGLHHLVSEQATGVSDEPAGGFREPLAPGALSRITTRDLVTMRRAASADCAQASGVSAVDDIVEDAALVLARLLQDSSGVWQPRRTDPSGSVTTWTERARDGHVRLIMREQLCGDAVEEALRPRARAPRPAAPQVSNDAVQP